MPSFPEAFLKQMEAALGPAEAAALTSALSGESPVSVRLNPLKAVPAAGEAVPWCAAGRYLPGRPAFTFDPLLHAGAYYVQEASSMFVAQAFSVIAHRLSAEGAPLRRVLDLCAAPGGKSTLWRSLLPAEALLVANEPLRPRASVLLENMAKWGHPDVVVSNAYPRDFAPLAGFFDVVAADVPCSGEGMFRKDAEAVAGWSPEAVALCARRQREIVADVWPALREGGYLVYSTCTFNREEDEANVAYICRELGACPVEVPAEPAWGVAGDARGEWPVAHFYPHRARGEGFFLALLQKTAPAPSARAGRKARGCRTEGGGAWREVSRWLRAPGDFVPLPGSGDEVAAVRAGLAADVASVAGAVRVLSAGVPLAQAKGRKLVPRAALALSAELAPDAFPRVELGPDEAVAFLRREAPLLPAGVPRGYVVAAYEGLPLGFLNNLGSRANNLYPAEWRIRSTHTAVPPRVVIPKSPSIEI